MESNTQQKSSGEEDLWAWGSAAKEPRILHTMIRVLDLEKSLAFYRDQLGMQQISRLDIEAGRFSIVFLSYGGFENGAIELTHNWDTTDRYTHGTGFGHIAIGVPDIYGTCERLKAAGVPITVEPKILVPGGPALAFVKDPDGYSIELIQTSKAFSKT
jgi:lactoylglutathione lyase